MQLKGGTKSAASNAFWDRRQFIPLLGLFLVGLNLRADISALPPIYSRVAQDFPFSPTSQSLMGTLPLIAYAVFGVVSRNLISQVGIERSLITAMLFIFGGLVLINLRSRTPEGAAALSSFVQGVGYLFGAFGPLTVGLLATQTGAWVMPNIYMGAIALLPLLAGIAATRAVFVEDAMAIGKV